MPIDLMSPIQAIEHTAIAYKGFKEAKNYREQTEFEKQKNKSLNDYQTLINSGYSQEEAKKIMQEKDKNFNSYDTSIFDMANSKKNEISSQKKAEAYAEKEEKNAMAQQRVDAQTTKANAYADYVNKLATGEQRVEIARHNHLSENSKTRRAKLKYQYDNSKDAGDIAEQNLKNQQEAIYNSQIRLGGDE